MNILKNPLSCLETRDGANTRNETEVGLSCSAPCTNTCWPLMCGSHGHDVFPRPEEERD